MVNKLLLFLLVSLGYCAFALAQACPVTLELTAPSENFDMGYQHLEAQTFIKASNRVTGTAKITYDAGEYVLLQNGFYAASNRAFWVVIDGCAGDVTDIKEAEWLPGTTLAPNPSSGLVQIRFGEPARQALSVHCLDLMGRVLLHKAVMPGTQTLDLDLSAFPQGVYIVQVSASDTAQTMAMRVVVQ